jgi:hypothetical protein
MLVHKFALIFYRDASCRHVVEKFVALLAIVSFDGLIDLDFSLSLILIAAMFRTTLEKLSYRMEGCG